MKDTLKDIGDIAIDAVIAIVVTIIALNILGSVLVSKAFADEALTESERIVALTLLGEARGEGNMGMYAVGCVIQKRADERNLTPAKVCRQPYQFSIWNAGKGKVKKESELYYLWKSPSAPYARQLARHICKGHRLVQKTTGNANHYCTLECNPYWAKKRKPVKIIGNHKFYKLK